MARRSIGKQFNTVAGLFLIAAAVIGVLWLARAARSRSVGDVLGGISRGLRTGGAGAGYPIGGGLFGPQSSPVSGSPAVTAKGPAAAAPSSSSQPITVLDSAVQSWRSVFGGAELTPSIAATLPQATSVGGAATFVRAAPDRVDVYVPGQSGYGSVNPNNKFLGYVPGTNIPLFA